MMKKTTLLTLLLLLCGLATAWAQPNAATPHFSTDGKVYEYYIKLNENNRYIKNDYMSSNFSIHHNDTFDEAALRVKLVKTTGDYFQMIPLNVENFANGYICTDGTSSTSVVIYSTETTNSEWKLSERYSCGDANPMYNVLLKDHEALGLVMNTRTETSTNQSTILAVSQYGASNARVQFLPANDNAVNAVLLDKVKTILDNSNKVGYLETTNALYTNLNNSYTTYSSSSTSENLTVLQTAYDNYKASTDGVVQPSAGTVYHIDWTYWAPKSIYNSGDVSWGAFDASKNNYYWKIDENGKLMNGNGQYIKWDGDDNNGDHLEVTNNVAEASAVVITPIAGDNQFKIKFNDGNRYFHANNHDSGRGSGSNIITWDTSADSDGASAWRINEISGYDIYNVVATGLPEDVLYDGGVSLNNTDQKAYNGGFFVKEGAAFANTDFTALPVEGFQGNGITVSGNTITVAYRVNDVAFAASLQTHVDEAEELLLIRGLGYPRTGSTARTELQNMFATAEAAIADHALIVGDEIEHLKAKITAYKTSTDVELPEDGKAYTITSVQQTGNYVLYFDDADAGDNTLKIGARNEAASTYGASAIFVCRRVGDKCVFVNSGKGDYLSYRGKNTNYAESINAYTMQSTNERTDIPFGLFCPYAKRTTTGTKEGSLIVSINTTTYVGDNDNYDQNIGYTGNYSNVVRIEEVPDYRNKIRFTKLNNEDYWVATYSAPYPTKLPDGVTAYAVTSTSEGEGESEGEATTWSLQGDGTAIPADEGVLLAATSAIDPQYMVPATTETAQTLPTSENLLKPTPYTVTEDNSTAYILANGDDSGVGFYLANAGTVGAFRAYLELESASEVSSLSIRFGGDEATGIDGVAQPANVCGTVYDLTGRAVAKPVKGGLYIKNGVKFIQK